LKQSSRGLYTFGAHFPLRTSLPRTLRLPFTRQVAIAAYRDENAHSLLHLPPAAQRQAGDGDGGASDDGALSGSSGLVHCYVRKRPLFEYEAARGEYDVVSVVQRGGDKRGALLVHNCVMHPDMKV
jgi:hypothetical protein